MISRDNRWSRAAGDLRQLLVYRSVMEVGNWGFAQALRHCVPTYRLLGNYGLQGPVLYNLLFFSRCVPRGTCLRHVVLYQDAAQAWWCFTAFDE